MSGEPEGVDHVEGDADYRPVSGAAVFGLTLAVASTLALVTPWLTALPVVAAVVSGAAALGVRRSDGEKTGFTVAAAGLALSVIVLGASYVRGAVADRLHDRGAAPLAEAFLGHVRAGEFAAAHELTISHLQRRPSAEAAELFYAEDDDAKQRLSDFTMNDAVARVAASGAAPVLVQRSAATRLSGGRLTQVRLYELPASEDRPEAVLRLELRRGSTGPGRSAWQVADFKLAPSSGRGG